jgi:hypothetical protein
MASRCTTGKSDQSKVSNDSTGGRTIIVMESGFMNETGVAIMLGGVRRSIPSYVRKEFVATEEFRRQLQMLCVMNRGAMSRRIREREICEGG